MIITLHIHGSAAGEKARRLFGRIDCIALLIKKDKFCMAGRFSDAVFLIRHCIEIQDTGASGLCCSVKIIEACVRKKLSQMLLVVVRDRCGTKLHIIDLVCIFTEFVSA